MSDDTKLDKLAGICCGLIGPQLALASKAPKEALNDVWVLGYCFGMFDAMAQRAELDQYSEGFALITIGFIALLSDHAEGAGRVDRALDCQTDARFAQGNRRAGADLFAWLAERESDPKKFPWSLYDYLTAAAANR